MLLPACSDTNAVSAMGPYGTPAQCGLGLLGSQQLVAESPMPFALMQVRKESLDDPHILGQVQSKSSSFL